MPSHQPCASATSGAPAPEVPIVTALCDTASVLHMKSGVKFLLPPQNAAVGVLQQGFCTETVVKPSLIPVAGNGRFVAAQIKKGERVVVKPLYPMKEVRSLAELPYDATVTFEDVNDLEKYIALAHAEAGYSRGEVLYVFQHFVFGFDGVVCCLNQSTWTINHADERAEHPHNLNVLVTKTRPCAGADAPGAYAAVALCDIAAGDELHMDYRRFRQPAFFLEFAKQHGFEDVRRSTLTEVYGSEDPKVTGVPGDQETGF